MVALPSYAYSWTLSMFSETLSKKALRTFSEKNSERSQNILTTFSQSHITFSERSQKLSQYVLQKRTSSNACTLWKSWYMSLSSGNRCESIRLANPLPSNACDTHCRGTLQRCIEKVHCKNTRQRYITKVHGKGILQRSVVPTRRSRWQRLDEDSIATARNSCSRTFLTTVSLCVLVDSRRSQHPSRQGWVPTIYFYFLRGKVDTRIISKYLYKNKSRF